MLARPFLVPSAGVVAPETWQQIDGDRTVELGDRLEHWDYNTDLTVVRTLSLDLGRFRNEAGLPERAGLAAVAGWRSTSTGLRGVAESAPIRGDSVFLEMRLAGADLGGTLRLSTRIVLSEPAEAVDP